MALLDLRVLGLQDPRLVTSGKLRAFGSTVRGAVSDISFAVPFAMQLNYYRMKTRYHTVKCAFPYSGPVWLCIKQPQGKTGNDVKRSALKLF